MGSPRGKAAKKGRRRRPEEANWSQEGEGANK